MLIFSVDQEVAVRLQVPELWQDLIGVQILIRLRLERDSNPGPWIPMIFWSFLEKNKISLIGFRKI
jgi:hypothetical protein